MAQVHAGTRSIGTLVPLQLFWSVAGRQFFSAFDIVLEKQSGPESKKNRQSPRDDPM
jgi:hypothetical protein